MAGRPRQFEEDQVLDAAMRAFWAKGFEATSLKDLMDATGLHKGSLYQAFGDKHALFERALDNYLGEMRRHKSEILKTAVSPLDGIRAVGHMMIDMADADPACPKGCMAINALVELAPHDPRVQATLSTHMDGMRKSMSEAFSAAQANGQVSDARPPELLTLMLMTFMAGMATTMKGLLTKPQAHQLLDEQIDALV